MPFSNPNAPNLPDFLLFLTQAMQIPAAALPTIITAPPLPALTAGTSGGSLPTGTVYAETTYVSLYGETTASPQASVAVTGPTGQVVVASPAAQAGVTGYNVYAADAAGAEVLQNTSPIAIGTPYDIDALATDTAPLPASNTAASPWPGYAFNRALDIVLYVPTVAGLEYTMACYNCAGHILLRITPDQPEQTYFTTARQNFGLLSFVAGVISSSSDQGTSESLRIPESFGNLTVGDLGFLKTPWGREYIAYAQDFGQLSGVT